MGQPRLEANQSFARINSTGQRQTCKISDESITWQRRQGRVESKIDSDSLAFPVAVTDGAEFLIMAWRLIDGIGFRHGRAFGKVRRGLHMRGALAVEHSHDPMPFDCDAGWAIPYSCRACYLGREGE